MSRFDACLMFVLAREGGYVNDPDDPGGATNHGVTQKVYDAWRVKRGLPKRPVLKIEAEELYAIYDEEYWTPIHGDVLPAPVDLVAFDAAVNHGDGREVHLLQDCLHVASDGSFGPATMAAIHAADPRSLAASFIARRRNFYHEIVLANPKEQKFLGGWLRRMDLLAAECGFKPGV